MDSDEEWDLDDDEEVVMPRELPKGSLCDCFYDSLILISFGSVSIYSNCI